MEIDTNSIIKQVNQIDTDSKMNRLQLFELAIADHSLTFGLADGSLENAIRAGATKDPKVAAPMAQVAQERLHYTKGLFIEIGFPEGEA